MDSGSWMQGPGPWIKDLGRRIQDLGYRIMDPRSRILQKPKTLSQTYEFAKHQPFKFLRNTDVHNHNPGI